MINDYIMDINITKPITPLTSIEDIKKQLEDQQINTISKHITPEWKDFSRKKFNDKIIQLENSTTVIDFLKNVIKLIIVYILNLLMF